MSALNARDCPFLDVGALVRSGLLGAPSGTKRSWACSTLNDPLTRYTFKLQIRRLMSEAAIAVLNSEGEELQLIPVDLIEDSKGRGRWAFTLDGEPAYKLFLVQGRFETAKTHGLRYKNSRKPSLHGRLVVNIDLLKAGHRPWSTAVSKLKLDGSEAAAPTSAEGCPGHPTDGIASGAAQGGPHDATRDGAISRLTVPETAKSMPKALDEQFTSRRTAENDGRPLRSEAVVEATYSRHAEDHAAMRIERLQSWGLFGDESAGIGIELPARAGSANFTVNWDPVSSSLTLTDKSSSKPAQVVDVVLRGPSGRKCVRFVCPILGERCSDLYFVGGRLGSRGAFRLTYYSERLGRRQRLGLKRRMGGVPERYTLYEAKLIGENVHSQPSFDVEGDLYCTQSALKNAQSVAPVGVRNAHHFIEGRAPFIKAEELGVAVALAPLASDFELSLFELQPRLEMGSLRRAGLVVEGEARSALAQWDCERTGLDWVNLYVDLRDPEFRYVAIQSVFRRNPSEQLVRISPALVRPADRRFFFCPVLGTHVETLAWRAGRWASRVPQRLKNSSQRSERFHNQVRMGERAEWGAEGV